MGLLDMITSQRKSNKKVDDTIVTEILHPSGFLPLDYANGTRTTTYDNNDRPTAHFDQIGFVSGTKTTVIGLSGTGKSALGISIAASGIYKFGNKSYVQHCDIETASDMRRPIKVTKLPPSVLKSSYKIFRDMAAEDIIDYYKDHCAVKTDNLKEFTYNTGLKDLYGDPIHELYPSAALLDSFAMFKSKELDLGSAKKVEDVTHNMIAAQSAKFNKGVLSQMVAMGKKANVSLISINHLNKNVNTGFLPKPSQHMYLSQDETMPGGQATIYLANNIIKLKVDKKWNPSKPEEWDYGIPGFITEARLLKSRTNAANIPVELVFDHRTGGFSKVLTLLHYAFKKNILLGNPRGLYLEGYTRTKFTRKTFEDICYKDPELLEALYEACLPSLESMLSTDQGRNDDDESDSERLDAMYLAVEEHQRDVKEYANKGWVDFS